jgi:hypothetical protein
MRKVLEELRQAFIARDGREPGPDDLPFPDSRQQPLRLPRLQELGQRLFICSQQAKDGDLISGEFLRLFGRESRRRSPWTKLDRQLGPEPVRSLGEGRGRGAGKRPGGPFPCALRRP